MIFLLLLFRGVSTLGDTPFDPMTMFNTDSIPASYFVDGVDRFKWYRLMHQATTNHASFRNIKDIYGRYAYEYEYEYSVSYWLPNMERASVYCRYLDENGNELLPSYHSFTFPEYIVNCPKRYGTSRIAITANDTISEIGKVAIPLIDRQFNETKYELTMCLSPIYGSEAKWLLLTQFVEHYKLQGVERFYLYLRDTDPFSYKILQDYQNSGDAEVTEMGNDIRDMDTTEYLLASYQDCLLRNRQVSRWSIFVDLDELILMSGYPGRIVDYLRENEIRWLGAIQFRPMFITKTEKMPLIYKSDKQVDNWLPILRWRNSSQISPPYMTSKCIVDPKKVLYMWIHMPLITFPEYNISIVDPDIGYVRHYRGTESYWGRKHNGLIKEFGEFSVTDYPTKYRDQLIVNVKKRLTT